MRIIESDHIDRHLQGRALPQADGSRRYETLRAVGLYRVELDEAFVAALLVDAITAAGKKAKRGPIRVVFLGTVERRIDADEGRWGRE